MIRYLVLVIFLLVNISVFTEPNEEISKPLLRVFPTFRPEECEDWAIMPFVCKRCLWEGKRYAQEIRFYDDGPFRTHGCYTEKKGFEVLGEK
ncbi:hypothetical protein [Leptospira bouyouniensis]|uniref:Uncharacterized protein n=1 Tax=Leptospira bouyouniensis TaxID=2484911 RepID=A0A7I0HX17_9LEPT|nr:hypothetical protein [Leptospira bouyouniensis]TGK49770.1 hypothetical protein EHQ10_07935 [Leptospira bouyouniensis]TGL09479.1 hypothetical protein EHQ43_00970 [Leptospira bouyouniensis]TGM77955.1 hypothetical protein EHQ99_16605 [Leptospira bouyouniensis]